MTNAEVAIQFLVVCVNSVIVSLIVHFVLVKKGMPAILKNFSLRWLMLAYYAMYLILVSMVGAVMILPFILYKHLSRKGMIHTVTYLTVVHIAAFVVFLYTYVRSSHELERIDVDKSSSLYVNGIPAVASACSNKDGDEKTNDADYTNYDLLYNHQIYLVNAMIVVAFFIMSFLFISTFSLL